MIGSAVKSGVQKNFADNGKRNVGGGIRLGLDREYPDWKDPKGTYMVPSSFPPKQHQDKGSSAEEVLYNCLQQHGSKNKEPMFVVHSFVFSEHIPDCERKRSWVMGETDFVIIHKIHGPILIQVKATENGKSYKEAEEQLQKDKLVLQKFFLEAVKGNMSAKKVTELFKNYPAFVAMPNCPRPSVCVLDNVIYREDCSSLEGFEKWWKDKVETATHPAVRQDVYEYLVMRFVGKSYLKPCVSLSLDEDDKSMIFLTQQQMRLLAGHFAPKLWIRGPAGSGKTYLVIEKAVTLARNILSDRTKATEKVLVLCFNSVLCKALQKTIENHFPDADVSSFVHFKTFAKLVVDLACLSGAPNSNDEKETSVNLAWENLKVILDSNSPTDYMYDHILVDEGQDLFGKRWPELLQLMHKKSPVTEEGLLAKPGLFWVMYDMNQYLYFAKEQAQSHFSYLSNSAELNQVFRNTGHVFEQSMKYFKSLMSNDTPISLGHKVRGLPIKWDASLASRSGEERLGANKVVEWTKKLQQQHVRPKDICILVENEEKKRMLQVEINFLEESCQTGDDLVEKPSDCVVLESTRRFKGMESKVVILYNPPFQDDPSFCTKELLYTAVSRCSCYLVVITTKEGCKALMSDVGINEESRIIRKRAPWRSDKPASAVQCRQEASLHEGDLNFYNQHKFSRLQGNFKLPDDQGDDDDHEGVSINDLVKHSVDELQMHCHNLQLSEKRAVSMQARPMEIDGSNLFEPGDPNIKDERRDVVFRLLGEVVEENLKYIPDGDPITSSTIIAFIEYEVYNNRRHECRPQNYTADLRKLKEDITTSNKKRECHDCVMSAAKKIRDKV